MARAARAQGLIPDDVIAQGEAALKSFAEGKAGRFQSGADLGMLDTDKIVAQVRAEIDAQKELERIKAEVVNKLHEGGSTGAKATAAVDKVLRHGHGNRRRRKHGREGFSGWFCHWPGIGARRLQPNFPARWWYRLWLWRQQAGRGRQVRGGIPLSGPATCCWFLTS